MLRIPLIIDTPVLQGPALNHQGMAREGERMRLLHASWHAYHQCHQCVCSDGRVTDRGHEAGNESGIQQEVAERNAQGHIGQGGLPPHQGNRILQHRVKASAVGQVFVVHIRRVVSHGI